MYNFRAIGKVETTIIDARKKSSNKLDLRSCYLDVIPPAIYIDVKTFKYLVIVDLSNNAITDIPSEFWTLTGVENLNFAHNRLKTIDAGLKNMVNISTLNLGHNNLRAIPGAISSLKKLKSLNLIANNIIHFDRSILLLPNLTKLLIFHNSMRNLPGEICSSSLTTLRKHFKLGLHHESPRQSPRVDRKGPSLSRTPRKVRCALAKDLNNNEERKLGTPVTELEKCNIQGLKLQNGNIEVNIPDHLSPFKESDYQITTVKDSKLFPNCLDERTVLATQIISLSPHGALFGGKSAIITLPLSVSVESNDDVICMFSDTDVNTSPNWKKIPIDKWRLLAEKGRIEIETDHFSLFCALLSRPYPSVSKKVSVEGGEVKVAQVPGAQLHVPKSALPNDTEISMEILYDDGKYGADEAHDEPMALATPVVKLGPSGIRFCKPVLVSLPVPDCVEIQHLCNLDPERNLTIWCSQTETLEWKEVKVTYTINVDDSTGLHTVTFPVEHFSWYRALWDCMAKTIHKAKLGCAHYYPSIQFSMMCKAMLDYQPGASSFGLEILCYRSDESLPEPANLKSAGGSLKPRMVKTGDLLVKLVSNCFEADVENGEVAELKKWEFNFRGYEFEKQFACLARKLPRSRGVFGKVFVERIVQKGVSEPLFEFNLVKKEEKNDSLSLVAIKEMAGVLGVDTDIGILSMCGKLVLPLDTGRKTDEPFAELLSAYQAKGGNSDKFVEVMYEVSRSLKRTELNDVVSSPRVKRYKTRSQRNSRPISPDEEFHRLLTESPQTPVTPGPFDELLREIDQSDRYSATPKRKRPDDVIDGCALLPSKRQCVSVEDTTDSVMTSQSPIADVIEDSDYHLRNDETEIEERKLWSISEGILHKWRAVARTLELPEIEIVCLEQKHGTDLRECAYQMLLSFKSQFPERCTYGHFYQRLIESGLRLVAQKHCVR